MLGENYAESYKEACVFGEYEDLEGGGVLIYAFFYRFAIELFQSLFQRMVWVIKRNRFVLQAISQGAISFVRLGSFLLSELLVDWAALMLESHDLVRVSSFV